jgi:cell division protease FtsH
MSEETMRKVDAEVRHIIDQQYGLARRLLEENRDKVEAMTAALLEFETIDSDQISDVMEGRPVRAPKPSGSTRPPADSAPGAATGGATAPA